LKTAQNHYFHGSLFSKTIFPDLIAELRKTKVTAKYQFQKDIAKYLSPNLLQVKRPRARYVQTQKYLHANARKLNVDDFLTYSIKI